MRCTIRDVDCCAHKKSFVHSNTVVRSLGPYMRVERLYMHCTDSSIERSLSFNSMFLITYLLCGLFFRTSR